MYKGIYPARRANHTSITKEWIIKQCDLFFEVDPNTFPEILSKHSHTVRHKKWFCTCSKGDLQHLHHILYHIPKVHVQTTCTVFNTWAWYYTSVLLCFSVYIWEHAHSWVLAIYAQYPCVLGPPQHVRVWR